DWARGRNEEGSARVGTIRPRAGAELPVGWPSRNGQNPVTHEHKKWMSPTVIYVTRLDGSQLVVNADLIETDEHTADTVITLLDGKKLVVATHVDEVVESVIGYRQLIARGPLRL